MIEIKVPRECYKFGSGVEQSKNEGGVAFEVLGISTNETIQLQIKDAQATWAVWADNEIISKTNAIKSLFIESIKLLVQPRFILGTLITILNKKTLNDLLSKFNRQAFRLASVGESPYFLKERHLTPFSRELHYVLFMFLVRIGVEEDTADRFADLFSHILEYDNAYRMRAMDILAETSPDKMSIQELKRLSQIIYQRDAKCVGEKQVKILKLLSVLLLFPKYRNALLTTLRECEFTNLQPQESDLYWMCCKNGYKFMGKTDQERKEFAIQKGWSYPENLI